ncbi:hypothetical protein F2Q68_00035589 [Brassica cretica]|uniref:Uncharacterized protein n=1 Tax=Brassica cretica TaxID=69181 RepID=A0A8S9HAV7_BRACR|nr:hypothetical protein F2Q68_00035589 [Brassica cretica]
MVMGRALYSVGFWIRETGQALDRLGCRLQGKNHFREQRTISFHPSYFPIPIQSLFDPKFSLILMLYRSIDYAIVIDFISILSRHRTLMNVFDKSPSVDKQAFVAPSASLIGNVHVGPASSIWYGCVLRGDANSISVGAGTNIQDNTLVHVAKSNLSGKVLPTLIGDNVTVGHSAVLHGCTVEDEAYIGASATVLDGAHVEKQAMVESGALVRQNTRIPSGEVWGGNPARFLRKVTEEEKAFFSSSAVDYSNLAQVQAAENTKNLGETDFKKLLYKKKARDAEYDSVLSDLSLSENVPKSA